jgi:hypothetical protein
MSDNNPTFLYTFTFPDGTIDRLTADGYARGAGLPNYGPDGVAINGDLYRYAPVSHGAIKQSNQIKKQELGISLPLSDVTARKLTTTPQPETIGLIIARADVIGAADPALPDVEVAWTGTVGGASIKKEMIEVVGVGIFASLQLAGNRARYTRLCRHALYGPGCKASLAAFSAGGFLQSSTGNTATVQIPQSPDVSEIIGGLLNYDPTKYFILAAQLLSTSISGNTYRLTLDRPFVPIPGQTSLSVAPGCDRTQETCGTRFNNLANFGGFPYIPSKNPFQLSSIV